MEVFRGGGDFKLQGNVVTRKYSTSAYNAGRGVYFLNPPLHRTSHVFLRLLMAAASQSRESKAGSHWVRHASDVTPSPAHDVTPVSSARRHPRLQRTTSPPSPAHEAHDVTPVSSARRHPRLQRTTSPRLQRTPPRDAATENSSDRESLRLDALRNSCVSQTQDELRDDAALFPCIVSQRTALCGRRTASLRKSRFAMRRDAPRVKLDKSSSDTNSAQTRGDSWRQRVAWRTFHCSPGI